MRRHILFLALILVSWAHAEEPARARPRDAAAVHGMVLFGSDRLYLATLPRFEAPRDYQAILLASFDNDVRDAIKRNMRDNPGSLYTVEPAEFSLPTMVERPVPFPAMIYRGDYRKSDERRSVFPRQVMVTFAEALHFRRFDPRAVAPKDTPYLLFGTRDDAYLAHYITAAPDYLQILSVTGDDARPRPSTTTRVNATRELAERDTASDGKITVRKQIFRETLEAPRR